MKRFPIRCLFAISIAFSFTGVLTVGTAFAQQEEVDAARKIVSRVVPNYPELARKMGLQGTVKMQVTVAPDGTPKLVEILGGHPVLAKAAENGVYKWRWIPTQRESKELVELRFHPE